MQRPDAAQDPQYATIKAMFDTVHQQVGKGGTAEATSTTSSSSGKRTKKPGPVAAQEM